MRELDLDLRSTAVIALAMLLCAGAVAPFVGSVAAQSTAPGMDQVPTSNIEVDLPAQAKQNVPSEARISDSIAASKHADSLEIEVTTADRLGPDQPGNQIPINQAGQSDQQLVIVASDDQVSEGREIAVDRQLLEESVGHEPDVAFGLHDSGERWSSGIRYQDDRAVLEIPHFSSNTVSFESRVEISATPADDGAQFEYAVADSESVEDASLRLTGSSNTKSESVSYTGVSDDDTVSLDINGNAPADLMVEFTGAGVGPSDPTISKINDPAGPVEGVAVSGDGSVGLLGISDTDGSIYVINLSDAANPTVDAQITDPTAQVRNVDINNNGTVGIAGSSDDNAYIFDLTDPKNPTVSTISDPAGQVSSVSVSGDGSAALAGARDGTGYVIDTSDASNPDVSATISAPTDRVASTALDSDGNVGILADGFEGNDAHVLDLSDLSNPTVTTISQPSSYFSDGAAAISDDGSVGVLAPQEATAYILDISDPTNPSVSEVTAPSDSLKSADISDDGSVAMVGGVDNSVNVLDLSDPTSPTQTSEITDPANTVDKVSINSDGSVGLIGSNSNNGEAFSVDLSSLNSPSTTKITNMSDRTGAVDISDDGVVGLLGSDDTNGFALEMVGSASDPTLSIDGKTASYSGELADGETHSETLADVSTGSYTESASLLSGEMNLDLSWTETTRTTDPSVEIATDAGDQTLSYSGTLSDGSTTDLSDSIDESRIGGIVTVNVSVSESVSDGPIGKVGLEFSHTATEDRSINYQGEEFSERYSTSYTWEDDRSDAKMRIPWASDRIVSVRTVTVDGSEISDYQTSGGELIVPIGSVSAGETTNVSATGSKIQLESGSVEVVEPTTVGNNLDSKIKITDAGGGEVRIDVSGVRTVDDDERVLYSRQESWTDADPRAELSPGEQILVLEPPSSGSTARIRSSDIGARAVEGDAVVRVLDSSEPRLKVSSGDSKGDVVELIYHDTVSGDHYRVTDSDSSDVLDTDQAESPVRLRVSDTSGILSIESFVPNAAVNAAAGAVSGGGDGSLFGPIVLVVVVVAAIGALAILSRRTGLLESREGTAIVSLGILIVGYIAAELVTGRDLYRGILGVLSDSVGGAASVPGSIVGSIVSSVSGFGFGALVLGVGLLVGLFAIDQRTEIDIPRFGWIAALGLIGVWFLTTIGASLESPIAGDQLGAVLIAIAIPIALLALDQRTSLSIPIPLYIGVALVDGVFVLETLSPGGVLEPLSSGLDEIGPLIWILLIGGAMVVIWLWLRSRRPEITIRGGGGS